MTSNQVNAPNLYAKLQVKVVGLQLEKYKLRNPHIHVRLGPKVYVTPKRVPEHCWNDIFEFDVSFHQHLFWMVQIDVYDSRFLWPHTHVARAELRLYRLKESKKDEQIVPEWIKLREKQHCYANLGCLDLPDRELKGYTKGSIGLEIKYEPQMATIIDKETLCPIPTNPNEEREPNLGRRSTTPISIVSQNPFVIEGRRWASLPTLLPSMRTPTLESDWDDISVDQEGEGVDTPFSTCSKSQSASLEIINTNETSPRHFVSSHSPAPSDNGIQYTEQIIIEQVANTMTDATANVLVSSRDTHSLAKKISGWILREEDYHAVQNVLNSLAAFGQGVVVGRVALTIAYFLVQRYHRRLPVPFTNNVVLTKEDLLLPRIIFKYAFAAHGWAALFFFGKRKEMLSDMVSMDANYKAVLEYLELEPTDLPICDLDQHRLFRPNFYVALDRRLKAVILSIRGTMSIRDTLTDLAFDYVPWKGGTVHSGILMSARWFFDHLSQQLVQLCRQYDLDRIIVTGHSLGGGVAALTTIMLYEDLLQIMAKEQGESLPPSIHCYSYGPPPILSPELAIRYAHLIDTFVFGDDVVPRLSYGTVLDLQVLTVYAAEISGAGHLFSRRKDVELNHKLEACRAAIRAGHQLINPKLHLPGRIHHLLTLKTPRGRRYTVVDNCGPERFCELILRKGMLTHHMPNRYERALEDAYVTYLMHELEERQVKVPITLGEKLRSVIKMIMNGHSRDRRSGVEDGTETMLDGMLFPRSEENSQTTDDVSDRGRDRGKDRDRDMTSRTTDNASDMTSNLGSSSISALSINELQSLSGSNISSNSSSRSSDHNDCIESIEKSI